MRPGSALCASAGTASAIGRPSARSRGHPTIRASASLHSVTLPLRSTTHMPSSIRCKHFPSPPILFQLVQVAAVRLPAEGERHGDSRQKGPQLVGNQLGDGDGDRGADDVGRCRRGGSRRPSAIDRAPREHRHEQARPDARHETVRGHGRRDWNGLPRPDEMIGRPTEPEVGSAGSPDSSHRQRGAKHGGGAPFVLGGRGQHARGDARDGDSHCRRRTVQEQRDELDHERRPHRAPERADRPGSAKSRRQGSRSAGGW